MLKESLREGKALGSEEGGAVVNELFLVTSSRKKRSRVFTVQ
jgi:hypothetical protein